MKRWICSALALLLVAASLNAAERRRVRDKRMPQPVRTTKVLAKLLSKERPRFNYGGTNTTSATDGTLGAAGPVATVETLGGASKSDEGGAAFSGTNVQVAGVDEADVVKTDGEYLYFVQDDAVLIIKAYPETDLAVTAKISFDSGFRPQEVFVEAGYLAVLGTAWNAGGGALDNKTGLAMPVWQSSTVKALVYDLSDKTKPALVRQVQVDGYYLSSRKIAGTVFLIARKYPQCYALMAGSDASSRIPANADGLVPQVLDSATGTAPQDIDLDNVFYFPKFNEPDYVVVASFDMTQAQKPADIKAYLGAGETVYASTGSLYIAASQFAYNEKGDVPFSKTALFKFTLADGIAAPGARGEVPGTLLNQFSLDEHDGFLRVATTSTRSNNVYVLNADMRVVGKLEGIAPDERIYSTRFVGERCYMVTFKQVDPLFVIGFSSPYNPVVLGSLEMPGFSSYLHPFDDTHLLGFGMNADADGRVQGMKIALYDVADVKNPVQLHATNLGDWSGSEVLHDHKALLFDREKGLLAFPVWVGTPKDATAPEIATAAWFEGAYVYDCSLAGGFVLRKAITHYPDAQPSLYTFGLAIRRLLYIAENLYTLSPCKVKVHGMSNYEEKKSLEIGTPMESLPVMMASPGP